MGVDSSRYLIVQSDGKKAHAFLQSTCTYWQRHPDTVAVFEIPPGVRLIYPTEAELTNPTEKGA